MANSEERVDRTRHARRSQDGSFSSSIWRGHPTSLDDRKWMLENCSLPSIRQDTASSPRIVGGHWTKTGPDSLSRWTTPRQPAPTGAMPAPDEPSRVLLASCGTKSPGLESHANLLVP